MSLIAAYTYGKSIDDTSAIRIQGYDTLFPQNSYCIRCERGFSSFDTRNRVVISPLYELPIGKGKPLNVNNALANAVIARKSGSSACAPSRRRMCARNRGPMYC